jgi:hypothetical protein
MNRDRGGERQFLMLVQEWRSCASCSTLACCPPPAQVFSQQLPNQHVICFFRFLKYKMISKLNVSWGYILFYQNIYTFENCQATRSI